MTSLHTTGTGSSRWPSSPEPHPKTSAPPRWPQRAGCGGACFVRRGLFVEGWVGVIDVLLVQLLPHLLDGAAEALEVDDLPLPEEADDVGDVGVVLGQAEDVVVPGGSG